MQGWLIITQCQYSSHFRRLPKSKSYPSFIEVFKAVGYSIDLNDEKDI